MIVREPGSGAEPHEFQNPVNINRLVRTVTWHVAEPDNAPPLKIEIETGQAGTCRAGVIIAHGYGGLVRVKYDDDDSGVWVDLPRNRYRWLL